MALAHLKKRPREFEEFCRLIELAPKQMMQELMTFCLAFLLPVEAGCKDVKYESRGNED